MVILETKRLVLRQFVLSDNLVLVPIFCDPDVMEFSEGLKSEEAIRDWLHECVKAYYAKRGWGPWAVVEKSSGNTIGYCGLFYVPDVNGQPEIEVGNRLNKSSWGNGMRLRRHRQYAITHSTAQDVVLMSQTVLATMSGTFPHPLARRRREVSHEGRGSRKPRRTASARASDLRSWPIW